MCGASDNSLAALFGHHHHLADVELVSQHSVARTPECFAERHVDLASAGQSIENSMRVGFRGNDHGQSKTREMRIVSAAAIGRHDRCFANLKRRVHNFVLETCLQHPSGNGIGTFAETHHAINGCSRCLFLKLKCLFATATEKQV